MQDYFSPFQWLSISDRGIVQTLFPVVALQFFPFWLSPTCGMVWLHCQQGLCQPRQGETEFLRFLPKLERVTLLHLCQNQEIK